MDPAVPVAPIAGDDAPPDELPADTVVPPAPPAPAVPPTLEQAEVRRVIDEKLAVARVGLGDSERRQAEARVTTADLDRSLVDGRALLPVAAARLGEATAGLAGSRARMRKWAVRLYAGQSLAPVRFLFETGDLRLLPRRVGLANGGAAAAQRDVRARRRALADVDAGLAATVARVGQLEAQADQVRQAEAAVTAEVERWRQDVASLEAGQDVAINVVAFPVAGESRFSDTFGAPRMTGTRFAHAHQGVDILAGAGTPVVAFERGVLARVGTDILGGRKLWLVGQSGTRYYYAHLQGYAPGVTDGLVVEAGQVVASVGSSGNAAGGPAHLHLEIRPGGGAAVNPYPVLRQILDVTG